jgi:hypothetical protein
MIKHLSLSCADWCTCADWRCVHPCNLAQETQGYQASVFGCTCNVVALVLHAVSLLLFVDTGRPCYYGIHTRCCCRCLSACLLLLLPASGHLALSMGSSLTAGIVAAVGVDRIGALVGQMGGEVTGESCRCFHSESDGRLPAQLGPWAEHACCLFLCVLGCLQ